MTLPRISSGREDAKLRLTVTNSAWGLPSYSADCLRTMLYLRAAGLNAVIQPSAYPYASGTGPLPALQWRTKLIAAEDQLEFLQENFADLDERRSAEELADIRAYLALLDEKLAPVTGSLMFANEENYSASTRRAYAANAPWPVGSILRLQERRRVQKLVEDRKVDTLSAAVERARTVYLALSSRLGEKQLFFEGGPSTLDVSVAAQIAVHFAFPGPNNKLREILTSDFPSLLAHAQRLLSRFLQCTLEGAPAAEEFKLEAPLPKLKTPHPIPERYYQAMAKQDAAESREEERRKVARNNRFVLGVAFTVLAGVILFKNFSGSGSGGQSSTAPRSAPKPFL